MKIDYFYRFSKAMQHNNKSIKEWKIFNFPYLTGTGLNSTNIFRWLDLNSFVPFSENEAWKGYFCKIFRLLVLHEAIFYFLNTYSKINCF